MAGGGKFIVSFAAVYTVVAEIPAVKLAAGLLTKDSVVTTTNQLTILVMNLLVECVLFIGLLICRLRLTYPNL